MLSVTADRTRQILADPVFRELVLARAKLRWSLSILTLILFFGFIGLIFNREERAWCERRGKRHIARPCPRSDFDRVGRPSDRNLRPAFQFALRRTYPRAQSEVRPMIRYLLAALFAACPLAASAQTAVTGAKGPDWVAIGMFALIVLATLVIIGRSRPSRPALRQRHRALLRPAERREKKSQP